MFGDWVIGNYLVFEIWLLEFYLLFTLLSFKNLKEGVGCAHSLRSFRLPPVAEPTGLSPSGFQDRRLKPLGHPSVIKSVRSS